MKAVGYLRVSDPSQVEGHSLDAQERLFHELCKNRGWEAGKIYREEGRSAHVEAVGRRPVFRQLLDDAGHGQFDIIVVHTLDRWSRNQRVMLESLATLARHNVSLVSITENIDYSTPQGKLFTQMLGSFAEYFSDSLSTHVSKGMEQRAYEGRHTGGIPFGYDTCWIIENRKKRLKCETEHPGGVHLVDHEAQAVRELFRRYSLGTTTLSQLAVWLNGEGLRTRNTKKLPDGDGHLTAGPRLFTTASVRGILHNPFYMGKVSHKGQLLPGVHVPLVSPEMFETVQAALKKNSGRSETLNPRPKREYLLKGLIRCAYCGMPMWAQTYNSGRGYYREETRSRSGEVCPAEGASMPCHVPDGQIGKIVEAIELGPKWLEEVLAIISLQDQVQKIREERGKVQEKLRRMAKAYMDGLFPDDEYHRQKRMLEMELEGLAVPEANAAEEAGKLVKDLPNLWAGAALTERRKLLMSMLDAIYVDARDEKRIVALKPKPAFRPVFQVATTKEGSGVELLTSEPPEKPPEARPCFWWRRGRVELPVQKNLPRTCYRLS